MPETFALPDDGFETLRRTIEACGATGNSYGIVMRDGRVLLALPGNRDAALKALSLYQPQKGKPKWLKAILTGATHLGLHHALLKRWKDGSCGGRMASPAPGILVGSRGHECERSVAVAFGPGGWMVTKFAFGPAGEKLLEAESSMLAALASDDRVPDLLEYRSDAETTMLSMAWQAGKPWDSLDPTPLLQLLDDWSQQADPRPLAAFPEWPWIEQAIRHSDRWRDRVLALASHTIPPSIRHGDLTRPNLRRGPDGRPRIHDWERGALQGIPGLDLAHFLVQDAWFTGSRDPSRIWNEVLTKMKSAPIAMWLERSGWGGLTEELIAMNFALNTGADYIDQSSLLAFR